MNEVIARRQNSVALASSGVARAPRAMWLDIFQDNCSRLLMTAALVTGSFESAEAAIVDSVDFIDQASSPSARAALLAVAASAIRVQDTSTIRDGNRAMPEELNAVVNLRPDLRACFVLRRLAGLTNSETSKLLSMEPPDVEQRTLEASIQLARLHQRGAPAHAFRVETRAGTFVEKARTIGKGVTRSGDAVRMGARPAAV